MTKSNLSRRLDKIINHLPFGVIDETPDLFYERCRDNGKFNRPDWDEYFMIQSELVKIRSNCITRKVGCVITKNNIQISAGYNGTPPGIKNCFEGGCERCADRMHNKIKSGENLDRCTCVHAEANALMHGASTGMSFQGATAYVQLAPCLECTKMLITMGIKRVVSFGEYAENDQGLKDQANIEYVVLDRKKTLTWLNSV